MRDQRRPYAPALDGLRGLAVSGVFLFHCEVPWMAGGFLGVSTFFTLSGYLITALLLAEWERTGRIDLVGFWERRVRRLVPAGVLVVTLVVALAPLLADPAERRSLPGDARAALLYVANWHFARAGTSYAALFATPSVLQHFWSLGVEGQFYLVFPVAMAAAARRGGWCGMGLLVSSLGLASALVVALLASRPGTFDRIYYGSDTRALELLVGAVAALLAARPAARAGRHAGALFAAAGAGALAVQLGTWTTTTLQTPWVTHGGLGTYALLSAVVIVAAARPRGPVPAVLAWTPLRRLGEISYGFYLVHWPVILWLTPERLGLAAPLTDLVRAVVTVLVAAGSYRALERPVRTGQWGRGRRVFGAAGAATVGLAIVTRVLPVPAPDPLFAGLEQAARGLNAPPVAAAPSPQQVRYAVFGDSTAAPTARAFATWHASHPSGGRFAPLPGSIRLGCGILGPAERRDVMAEAADPCPDVVPEWAERVRTGGVRLALVQTGAWESREHALTSGGPTLRPGDAAFDVHLREQMQRVVDALAGAGAVVVWIAAPHLGPGKALSGGRLRLPAELRDPARIDRHNALLRETAAARPDALAVVETSALLAALPGGELDAEARPDGMHLTDAAADRLAPAFGRAIAAAYDRLRGHQSTADRGPALLASRTETSRHP